MFLRRGDVYLDGRGGILWCRTDHIYMRLIMALEKILFCVAKAYYSQTLYFRQLSCHLFSILHRCFPVNFTKFLEHVFYSTAQQMIFPLKISSVNVTNSAVSSVSCGFVTFTEKIRNRKLHFLCSVVHLLDYF